jgi:hypothetical protein
MEYFEYDYSKINKEKSFKNYERFISGSTNRYYLFDLGLIKYDQRMPKEIKTKAENILKIQKLFFILPYPVVLGIFLYKRKLFNLNYFEIEFKLATNLFLFVLLCRGFQKGLLKYQSEEFLEEARKLI